MKIAIAEEYFPKFMAGLVDGNGMVMEEQPPVVGVAELEFNMPIWDFIADWFISALRYCSKCDEVDAVMISVNSPGGEWNASLRLMTEIEHLGKPVFIHTNLLASGALLFSLPADKIYAASEMSEIGSIGTVYSYPVDMDKYIKTLYSNLSPKKHEEMRALQEGDEEPVLRKLDKVAAWFQGQVRHYRGLSGEVGDTLDGGMFDGRDAMNRGLIDGIMSYPMAIQLLRDTVVAGSVV